MFYMHGGGYVHGVPEQFGTIIKDFIETEPCIPALFLVLT